MPSFKIAEGHVEVDADIDHNSIRLAANIAGRMAGEALGGAMTRGVRDTVHRERDGFWKRMLTPTPSVARALRTGIPDVLASPIGLSGLALGVTFAASFVSAIITSGMFALLQGGFIGLAGFALRKNEELAGSFKTLGVRASESLERAADPMVPAFGDALDTIKAMFGPRIEQPLHKIFAGIAPTVEPLAEGIAEMIGRIFDSLASPEFLDGFREVTDSISRELPRLGDAFGSLFTNLAEDSDDIAEGFGNVVTATGALLGFLGDVVIAGTKVFNIFADLGNQLDRLGLLAKHSGDDVAWWEKNIFEVSEMLVEMVTGTDDATKSAHRMGKEVKTASEIMREDAVSASEALEERLSSLKEEMDAANAAAEELESTFFDQARGALDLDQKLDDLKSAIESATEAADDHKKVSIEERTELRNVANTSLDVIEAMISQGKSTDSIVGKTDKARESFIKVAQEMGYTEEEAIDLADKYGLIPKDVKTKVDLINDEKAKAKAAAVAAAIAKIKSKIVTISINEVHTKIYRTGEGGYFFEAHGGNIGGQKPSKLSTAATGGVRSNDVMVGERRPEVVQLPFGTRVIPSLEQARGPFPSMTGRSAGGGGVNVHVYVQGSIRSDKELVGIIRDEFLSGGLRDLFPPPTTGGNN